MNHYQIKLLPTPDHLPRNTVLYRHLKATDKVPMYIGIGKPNRPKQIGKVGDGQRNRDWHEVYNEHGRIVEVLMTGLLEWQAKAMEVVLIFDYRRVYGRYSEGGSITNRSDGGEGCSGYKFTEDQLAKHSAAMKIANSRPEVRAKRSASAKVAQKTAQSRPEVRAKRSASLTGKLGIQARNFQGYAVGVNGQQFVILAGSKEMQECEFNHSHISKCISGRLPHHKSFTWTRHSTINPDDFAGLEPYNELSAERIKK